MKKKKNIKKEIERVKSTIIKPTEEVNSFLKEQGTSPITTGVRLSDLLKRPELNYNLLAKIDENRPNLTKQEADEVNISLKYEGYINLEKEQVDRFKKLENKKLPENINYEDIKGLRLEARQKLNKVRPLSVGQASRISGVSPADISVLLYIWRQLIEKLKYKILILKSKFL